MIPTYARGLVQAHEDDNTSPYTDAGIQADVLTSATVSEAERALQLNDWNNNAVDYPVHICLHDLLEQQLALTPNKPALAFEDDSLTYAQLHHRANLLAHHLRSLGAGPEVPIGLFVERSIEMVVGILGILKAGSAYVPIDPATPAQRLTFLLRNTGISLILTQTHLLSNLPDDTETAINLDSFDWHRSPQKIPTLGVRPDNLAYIIYTSGSTGTPKGVCVEHRNIMNYVLGISERLGLEPGMNYAMVSTVAADLGNTVLFPALATGGCLHIISHTRAENQSAMAQYMEHKKIDVLKITPSHLAALQSGRNPERLMPRRCLILGGEASRLDWINHLRTMKQGCEIFNHYGPTETTVGVLTFHAGRNTPHADSGTLPLGTPLPNCRAYILDECRQLLPIGEIGELWIGGAGVSRGYLHHAELTAERFLPDPFAPFQGSRMYRTGDRARYLPNGEIEFLGRIDRQVKIRGYRVELAEIENVLREQPGIQNAIVTAVNDSSGTSRLLAYVLPAQAPQPLWANPSAYELPDGSSVAHLNKNETDYIYNEIFTLQAYLRHGISVHDGDCIIDAGANIGLFTVFLSRLRRNLRIFCFEPNPAAFACLTANTAAWADNTRCLPIGLSRRNTIADMTVFEGFSLLSGFHADPDMERSVVQNYVANNNRETRLDQQTSRELDHLLDDRFRIRKQSAQLRTLSSVIDEEGIDRIDLLKINVEKSELEILDGLEEKHWPMIRQLVIEVDEQDNLAPITSLLQKYGFEFIIEQDPVLKNTNLRYVYARCGEALADNSAPHNFLTLPAPQPLAPGERALTPAGLRKHLQARLPQHMVPAQFVLLEKLPLNANGKIDYASLPAPHSPDLSASQDFTAPRTATEKKLEAIWRDLLNVDTCSIHDDFFDLGGNSLLAIRAVAQIGDKFNTEIPLAALLESPTIAALAGVIDAGQETPPATSYSSLVSLRSTGSRPPLFLMHSHGGNTLEYRLLADLLGSEQPVYALQAKGLDGHIPTGTTMEEMAAAYVKELRSIAPQGPYFLGGYCLGGLLALEAAQQLISAGQKVALLALIQAMNPQTMRFRPEIPLPLRAWYKAQDRLNLEYEYLSSQGWRFMAERLRFHSRRAWVKAAMTIHRTGANHGSDLSHLPAHYTLEALEQIHYQVLRNYTPRPYSGDVLIFRAAKQPQGWIAGRDFGWNGILNGKVDFCDLPGHQQNLLHSPNVAQLADLLRSRMEAAQNRPDVAA